MEGSRHEKAAIVIASYVIGFITAFILFVNTEGVLTVETFISPVNTNSAAVVTSDIKTVEEVALPQVEEQFDGLSYNDGRLEMKLSDGIHLLSFNPSKDNLGVDLAAMNQGYHYSTLKYSLDDSGQFVFFCEQHSESVGICSAYVYDVNGDRIYSVTTNGIQVLLSQADAAAVTWTAQGLQLGVDASVNPDTPWIMAAIR